MRRGSFILLSALLILFSERVALAMNVLVFSKVQEGAYRHTSIPFGISAIREIGEKRGWHMDFTVDSTVFNDKDLKKYDVIVWNNTGGLVLDEAQRKAFQNYIHHGGGYAGIHMASAGAFVKFGDKEGSTCTEPGWDWFKELVGARFKYHKAGMFEGKMTKNPKEQIALDGVPNPWMHTDEWYEWDDDVAAKPNLNILLMVDKNSYSEKTGQEPVSWYQKFEGGRVFYTSLGHADEAFSKEEFRSHLQGGIEWAGKYKKHKSK